DCLESERRKRFHHDLRPSKTRDFKRMNRKDAADAGTSSRDRTANALPSKIAARSLPSRRRGSNWTLVQCRRGTRLATRYGLQAQHLAVDGLWSVSLYAPPDT